MTNTDYQRYLDKFLAGYKIANVEIYPGLVRVDMRPSEHWSICTFIFTENYITCFGDVDSFTWRTTWNAAKAIQQGTCNADNFYYLSEKLEHSNELKEFEFSDDIMEEIKKDIIDYHDFEDDDLKEFNEKWEENYDLIGYVDKHRIGGLDNFFEELEVDDYYEYYSRFEDYPVHYYMAVAMLRCIEDYFSKKEEK